MSKIRQVPTGATTYQYQFWCPGCKNIHAFTTPSPHRIIYQNVNAPIVWPSIVYENAETGKRCESVIINGNITFFPNCTHFLAGKPSPGEPSIELPDIEEETKKLSMW